MYNLPKCCGKIMKIKIETSRFFEVQCEKCQDTVFVKKEDVQKPQMLDD